MYVCMRINLALSDAGSLENQRYFRIRCLQHFRFGGIYYIYLYMNNVYIGVYVFM